MRAMKALSPLIVCKENRETEVLSQHDDWCACIKTLLQLLTMSSLLALSAFECWRRHTNLCVFKDKQHSGWDSISAIILQQSCSQISFTCFSISIWKLSYTDTETTIGHEHPRMWKGKLCEYVLDAGRMRERASRWLLHGDPGAGGCTAKSERTIYTMKSWSFLIGVHFLKLLGLHRSSVEGILHTP